MNRHAAVPTCPRCRTAPGHDGRKLTCQGCGAVLEDLSPPRKLSAAYRQLRWEEDGESLRLWWRGALVAWADGQGRVRVLDAAPARVIGLLRNSVITETFHGSRASAWKALRRLVELARPPRHV